MNEALLPSSLDTLIRNVRKNRYRPFSRGKHIQALQNYVFNSNLGHDDGGLLSVINDCLFPGQIEDILMQHVSGPCLLARLKFNNVDLTQYPAIQKVSVKYGKILLNKFIPEIAEHNLSDAQVIKVLRIFLERGVDFNAKDADGNTPLHIAASMGLLNTCKILVDDFGAIPELVNNRNQTPLEIRPNSDLEAHLKDRINKTFIAIEKRDVKDFSVCVDVWRMVEGGYKRHNVLGSPIEYLQKLINDYEQEKKNGWHTFGQWNRNRKAKKMLDIVLNRVLLNLSQLERLVHDSHREEINEYLGMLNEFSPEKIAEARRNNSALFDFIDNKNAQRLTNRVPAAVVGSLPAVVRATSANSNMEAVEQQPEVFEPVLTQAPRNIREWLAVGGNTKEFNPAWFELRGVLSNSDQIRSMLEKGHWKLVFSAAVNEKLTLNLKDRQYMFEVMLQVFKDPTAYVSSSSAFIGEFSQLLNAIKTSFMLQAFLDAVKSQQPVGLIGLMKAHAQQTKDKDLLELVKCYEGVMQPVHPVKKHV